MAMNCHVPPMIILLLSLFFLPTSIRATPFRNCAKEGSLLNVTSVEIFKPYEDDASFKILGSSTKMIHGGLMTVYIRLGEVRVFSGRYNDICEYMDCPIDETFELPFDKIFYLPDVDTLSYKVHVEVYGRIGHRLEKIMCINFNFRPSGSSLQIAA